MKAIVVKKILSLNGVSGYASHSTKHTASTFLCDASASELQLANARQFKSKFVALIYVAEFDLNIANFKNAILKITNLEKLNMILIGK